MINISFDGFDRDKGNIAKCQKHGMSVEEIEEFLLGKRYRLLPDIKHSKSEQRFIAAGLLGRKRIFIAFTLRSKKNVILLRPVSARYMHMEEADSYEKKYD